MLKGLKGRRAVVILTDGRDEDNPGTGPGSVRTWESVLRLLQDQDVTMFPVGLGPRIDAQRLELLATLSGGEAYFPQDVTDARGGVRPRDREPAPPLHRRLHLDQPRPGRQVAQRRDSRAGRRASASRAARATTRRNGDGRRDEA